MNTQVKIFIIISNDFYILFEIIMNENKFMKKKEIADFLGVSVYTINRYVNTKD